MNLQVPWKVGNFLTHFWGRILLDIVVGVIHLLYGSALSSILHSEKYWLLTSTLHHLIGNVWLLCYSDSTYEYISAEEVKSSVGDIYKNGLQCVTVLIGVFNRVSGEPVLGVVNQPFYTQHGSRWVLRKHRLHVVAYVFHAEAVHFQSHKHVLSIIWSTLFAPYVHNMNCIFQPKSKYVWGSYKIMFILILQEKHFAYFQFKVCIYVEKLA